MDKIIIKSASGTLPCKCIGEIIELANGKIALLDRRKGVLGWACPAGHIEPGEEPSQCLPRERGEEAAIRGITSTILVLHADINNACGGKKGKRPPADAHEWFVYYSRTEDDYIELKEPHGHKGIGWFSREQLRHLDLEPVWKSILEHLKII